MKIWYNRDLLVRKRRKFKNLRSAEKQRKFGAFKQVSASKNKAKYTATPVAGGWAGAVFEVTGLLGQEQ